MFSMALMLSIILIYVLCLISKVVSLGSGFSLEPRCDTHTGGGVTAKRVEAGLCYDWNATFIKNSVENVLS